MGDVAGNAEPSCFEDEEMCADSACQLGGDGDGAMDDEPGDRDDGRGDLRSCFLCQKSEHVVPGTIFCDTCKRDVARAEHNLRCRGDKQGFGALKKMKSSDPTSWRRAVMGFKKQQAEQGCGAQRTRTDFDWGQWLTINSADTYVDSTSIYQWMEEQEFLIWCTGKRGRTKEQAAERWAKMAMDETVYSAHDGDNGALRLRVNKKDVVTQGNRVMHSEELRTGETKMRKYTQGELDDTASWMRESHPTFNAEGFKAIAASPASSGAANAEGGGKFSKVSLGASPPSSSFSAASAAVRSAASDAGFGFDDSSSTYGGHGGHGSGSGDKRRRRVFDPSALTKLTNRCTEKCANLKKELTALVSGGAEAVKSVKQWEPHESIKLFKSTVDVRFYALGRFYCEKPLVLEELMRMDPQTLEQTLESAPSDEKWDTYLEELGQKPVQEHPVELKRLSKGSYASLQTAAKHVADDCTDLDKVKLAETKFAELCVKAEALNKATKLAIKDLAYQRAVLEAKAKKVEEKRRKEEEKKRQDAVKAAAAQAKQAAKAGAGAGAGVNPKVMSKNFVFTSQLPQESIIRTVPFDEFTTFRQTARFDEPYIVTGVPQFTNVEQREATDQLKIAVTQFKQTFGAKQESLQGRGQQNFNPAVNDLCGEALLNVGPRPECIVKLSAEVGLNKCAAVACTNSPVAEHINVEKWCSGTLRAAIAGERLVVLANFKQVCDAVAAEGGDGHTVEGVPEVLRTLSTATDSVVKRWREKGQVVVYHAVQPVGSVLFTPPSFIFGEKALAPECYGVRMYILSKGTEDSLKLLAQMLKTAQPANAASISALMALL